MPFSKFLLLSSVLALLNLVPVCPRAVLPGFGGIPLCPVSLTANLVLPQYPALRSVTYFAPQRPRWSLAALLPHTTMWVAPWRLPLTSPSATAALPALHATPDPVLCQCKASLGCLDLSLSLVRVSSILAQRWRKCRWGNATATKPIVLCPVLKVFSETSQTSDFYRYGL
uniref:Secreted protein n=1 Tax=Rousettus aegyptiacus TaxID=9407 RepID=A0A7J8HRQ0_ROUAE|nr:hypothetical protein HJG63_010917 [Rousettus aegyptiacus]